MDLLKAIEILQLNLGQGGKRMPPGTEEALRLGIEALMAITKLRYYPFPDEILRLPGETPSNFKPAKSLRGNTSKTN